MFTRLPPVRRMTGLLVLVLPVCFTACADKRPTDGPSTPPPVAGVNTGGLGGAHDELAALAAAAQDRHLTARYALTTPGRADRSVLVTRATDGTWRVDVSETTPGGGAISLAATGAGLHQCVIAAADRPPGCVRLGAPDAPVPYPYDLRVQHPFTDWLPVLTDRRAPLAVSAARQLPGAAGSCYSVESTTAALPPPLDVGIYCYDRDATITAVRTVTGTLTLVEPPGPAPDTVQLAGPVIDADPLDLTTPGDSDPIVRTYLPSPHHTT
ncbi:hypothetical protein ABT336_09830 [Micromonospora sp. NPDC000207]|uniref:hypothetical protein n=1 Tax=Micromonospora sp. NPDC000207 TaxID=3154246 RepID=UPI00331BBEF6